MAIDVLAVDKGWNKSGSVSAPINSRASGPMVVTHDMVHPRLCESTVMIDEMATPMQQPTDPFATTDHASSMHTADIRWSRARDYVQLTKPRIVTMIVVSTVFTTLIGALGPVDVVLMCWLLLGTAFVAASAGSANQVWERVIDGRMSRTAHRPLPSGRLDPAPAIAFTTILGATGIAMLYAGASAVPAAIGLVTWILYVAVYTPLKTRTSWNTTVGAIAGALPMLIGYTGAGGSIMDATGWLLVGILVAWQYPHFMAIAWICRQQYADAGFQMSTTVDTSGRSAGIQSVIGSVALMVCATALCWVSTGLLGGSLSTVAVVVATWPILRSSIQFAKQPGDLAARRLLRKSLLVLPAILVIVTVRIVW